MVSKLESPRIESSPPLPPLATAAESRMTRFERFEELSRRMRRGMAAVLADGMGERCRTTGAGMTSDFNYIHQSAWLARALATSQPKRHVDFSACPCLAAIASAFVPIEALAPSAMIVGVPGMRMTIADPAALPFRDATVGSISSSGIIERLGFGRDGSAVDPDADLVAIEELKRVTAPDGSLLLVCPIGKPRVLFDHHRVYAFGQVLDYFEGFDLEEFALVPDDAAAQGLVLNPDQRVTDRQTHGSGCFWFRRPAAA